MKTEKNPTHTPRPWRLQNRESHSPHRIEVHTHVLNAHVYLTEGKTGAKRGEVPHWYGFTPEQIALGHLLYAAPDLLEAVKWGLKIAIDSGMDDTDQAVKDMRAAIAKAGGQEVEK